MFRFSLVFVLLRSIFFLSTQEPCGILFFCRRRCLAHSPTPAPVHSLFEKRRWACRQLVLSRALCHHLPWNHISIHTLIISFDEKWGSSTAAALDPDPIVSPALAGKMQGFSWLIIALCCYKRDLDTRVSVRNKHWWKRRIRIERGLTKASNCNGRLWNTSDILQNTNCCQKKHFNWIQTSFLGLFYFLWICVLNLESHIVFWILITQCEIQDSK